MNKTIFLTGATGLVGQNLLLRILGRENSTKLILLVRGNSSIDVRNRINNIINSFSSEVEYDRLWGRIKIVNGDICLNNFGLSDSQYNQLAEHTTHIIHSAANTKFQLSLKKARAVNYEGTKNVMFFAQYARKIAKLQRIAHISTAYVSGNRSGIIYENELEAGQRFANSYEQTKYESEQYVHNLMNDLPITIFRPSIIVGDSKTGKTTCFNVLYYPINLIYHGHLHFLSGIKNTPLDVVPVDFVSDAIYYILLKSNKGIGETYHLTAGLNNETTAGEVIDEAVSYFNQIRSCPKIKPVKFISSDSLQTRYKNHLSNKDIIFQIVKNYEPYILIKRFYDNSKFCSDVRDSSIRPKPLKTYYHTLLAYCLNTNWGKQLRSAA